METLNTMYDMEKVSFPTTFGDVVMDSGTSDHSLQYVFTRASEEEDRCCGGWLSGDHHRGIQM